MNAFLVFFLGAAYLALVVLSFLKGRSAYAWIGVAGVIPVLIPFVGWFPLVGALRYAKPNSSWARGHYGPAQMAEAELRFPDDVAPDSNVVDSLYERPAPDLLPGAAPDPDRAPTPPATNPGPGRPDIGGRARRSVITAFLLRARHEGVIDPDTHAKLRVLLDRDQIPKTDAPPLAKSLEPSPHKPPPPTAQPPAPPTPPPPIQAPPRTQPPPRRTPAPVSQRQAPISRAPVPQVKRPGPPPVPTPRQPSPMAVKASEIWEAVASDVALHGFVYLGVLLTFVGVLGFLLFAFVDVADAAQPFVELFIVLIFFGWAWALRRQEAVRVADGMDMIGKVLLPLVLFASLVDNADFPPDYRGNALVVALTVTAVGTAAVYAWFATRNAASSLRFLVAPLLWLGAMTLGFIFKTDELLTSDAITRLVSAQPAMASAAIALTLAASLWKRDHRFAAPTVTAALVGVPIAYLLTISLAVGEDWANAGPLLVLGLSTMASVELLAAWFDRRSVMAVVRPWLLAGAVAPLVPLWGIGWSGFAVALSYLALSEWTIRSEPANKAALALTGAGIVVGAAMSLEEPVAALIGFTALSVWAHLRRRDPGLLSEIEGALTVAAAGLPVGLGYGLLGVLDTDVAWLIMASIVAVAAIAVRRTVS